MAKPMKVAPAWAAFSSNSKGPGKQKAPLTHWNACGNLIIYICRHVRKALCGPRSRCVVDSIPVMELPPTLTCHEGTKRPLPRSSNDWLSKVGRNKRSSGVLHTKKVSAHGRDQTTRYVMCVCVFKMCLGTTFVTPCHRLCV